MGRRKIEIKAIKDDRNRQVTFLKRKGGLFKKAYELSVLCSVDVAVIIFGHNKKLYEFSSGDINETIGRYQYYGGAHEHKGPEDFLGKKLLDDDDDEDMTPPPPGSHSPPGPSSMVPQLQNQPGYQHMVQHAPSASPPMNNRVPFHPHRSTPQPQQTSRPSSRNAVRRSSNNRGPPPPPHVSQAPPTQNGYSYMANGSMYHPQPPPAMNAQPPPGHPAPYQQYPTHPASLPKDHPAYMPDQRRESMPPAFSQERPQVPAEPSPPQTQRALDPQTLPQPIRHATKSQSIYTPIDDSHSLLSKHFLGSTVADSPGRNEPAIKTEPPSRPQSMDVRNGTLRNGSVNSNSTPPRSDKNHAPSQRNPSVSSLPEMSRPPRSNSGQFSVAGGAKRPRLTVQIPEESDHDSATAEGSPQNSNGTSGGKPSTKAPRDGGHPGVILPVPSPSAPASASALLSAGAQGPPNPFARPNPPVSNAANNNNIETPMSALPSRFLSDNLLPSPSTFFLEYSHGRGGGDSHTLPSPPSLQTPIVPCGPPFLMREDVEGIKRKSPDLDGPEGTATKKLKI
ncbi:MAG: hypothetical protein M1816_006451 [Peltula sp. TS41687]|nr:MAG: hypothetical protein M1816_006451 [Peltula sp. TS41687]